MKLRLLATLPLLFLTIVGCTRGNHRLKTDREATYLLDEKRVESCELNPAMYRIEIDPRSRMFDPFNPDRPPMPEDDPQANRYMRMVDRKKGYPLWEANGRTNIVENPDWIDFLPLDERGVLVLNLQDAVRIALLHSPVYQRNLEELYLSALDVSSERFRFDSQFFGGSGLRYNANGDRGIRTDGTMRKRFATGADLLVGVANDISWQVAGPRQVSTTILDFSLIQPLLRQAGRDVVLERLTLAERTLLSNVRAFERYRRGFYVQIAVGINPDTQPQRRGGVFGAAGFGGFTGLGGGFGTLGAGGFGGGVGGLAGGGIPGARGFLGLLQDQLQISNQQETVAQLTDVYLQLLDNYNELLTTIPDSQSAIPQQKLQVVQALQNVYNQQTNLLQAQAGFQESLDSFKVLLGLPPYLCVEINDPLLDRFKLVSQDLRDRRSELAVMRATIGENNSKILQMSTLSRSEQTLETFRELQPSSELRQELSQLSNQLTAVAEIQQIIFQRDFAEIRDDIRRLSDSTSSRRKQLNRLKDIAQSEVGMVCGLLPTGTLNLSFLDGSGLEQLPSELDEELEGFINRFDRHSVAYGQLQERIQQLLATLDQIQDPRALFQKVSQEIILGSQDLIAAMSEDVLAVQLLQARARTESIILPEVDIDPYDAVEIARVNRRDWLNNRAALVNSWRVIEVVADDLESILNLTVNGDVQTLRGSNLPTPPGTTGRMSVGLQWDAPITRLQERNNYRQALIEYQQAKRNYYRFEDGIWQSMRTLLRTIRQRQLAFEIQRFAVQTATQQIGVNEDVRQINESLGIVSPTAARDAITALNDLLFTQSEMIGIYVNYEALRRLLDLNLGTMELDPEGLWIDPGPIRADILGGRFGEAILNYALTDGDKRLRELIRQQGELPLEVAPSDVRPASYWAPGIDVTADATVDN